MTTYPPGFDVSTRVSGEVYMLTDPLTPELTVPMYILTDPLTPELPASGVHMNKLPEVVAED